LISCFLFGSVLSREDDRYASFVDSGADRGDVEPFEAAAVPVDGELPDVGRPVVLGVVHVAVDGQVGLHGSSRRGCGELTP